MTKNEIIEILKTGLNLQELQQLYINQIVKRPDARGFIQLGDWWFIYGNQDERGNISFNGPFDDSSLIYAIAGIVNNSAVLKHLKFYLCSDL